MSPAEQNSHTAHSTGQSIETVYTTVESQRDPTDWLTVVSNLRQINRQLVEEIAKLEQTLATTTQSLHAHKEQNQTHEITIMQQNDELKIARDRVGALFQQLENSHQIGQRQQTLIETLSQQLEIAQTVIPQLEAENEELDRKYQQQSQQLIKTERVAVELHRRLKQQATTTTPAADRDEPSVTDDTEITAEIVDDDLSSPPAPQQPETAPESTVESPQTAAEISTAEIEPAPPQTPLQLPQIGTSRWKPTPPPSLLEKTTVSPSPAPARNSWREEIANSNNRYYSTTEIDPDLQCPEANTADRESTALDEPTPATPNWPAPTLNRPDLRERKIESVVTKPVKIDLPKFPKRSEN